MNQTPKIIRIKDATHHIILIAGFKVILCIDFDISLSLGDFQRCRPYIYQDILTAS